MGEDSARPRCQKVSRGATAFFNSKDAAKKAKEIYDEKGIKIFIHACLDHPCYEFGITHLTHRRPSLSKRHLDISRLNQNILNYHIEKERFGTGTSPSKKTEKHRRLSIIKKQIPYLAWEDEGGALHPRSMED